MNRRQTKINRDRAVFEGSRLYRQAKEGSSKLLEVLSEDDIPYSEEIHVVSNTNVIDIASQEDVIKWTTSVEQFVKETCRQVSPQVGVPVLLQAIMDQYYGLNRGKSTLLGMYLKYSLELVSGNLYRSSLIELKSIRNLIKVVRAAALLYQVRAAGFLFEEFGTDGDYLRLSDSGIHSSENLRPILEQYSKSTPSHLEFMRTLSSTAQAIWLAPTEALKAVERVLGGERPQNQAIFRDTLFNKFSGDEPPEFWAGVWARLNLALYSNAFRAQVTDDFLSISVFQPFKAHAPLGVDKDLIRNANQQLFWEKDWYYRSINEQPTNLLSERPAVRAMNSPTLYVTSFLLVGDSLNWFIEASIVRYPEASITRLPDKIFQSLISEPFENSVIEIFRRYGFSAGRVSDTGFWSTKDRQVVLRHGRGETIPGEIDVLALHEESKTVILAECKVISVPFSITRMRNISRKLGNLDSEEFHTKISRKLSWLQATDYFKDISDLNFIGFIVVDVHTRWVTPGKHSVLDTEDLNNYLSDMGRLKEQQRAT